MYSNSAWVCRTRFKLFHRHGVTVVQDASDTCIGIASAAGIPLVTLVVNNPNVEEDCKKLFPGEVSTNRSHVQQSGPNSLSGFVHRQPDL
jgi:hypothetical protein